MKTPILLATALLLGLPALASAQPAAPPTDAAPMGEGGRGMGHPGMGGPGMGHPGMGGPGMGPHGMEHPGMRMGMMRPPKAAVFHFARGESEVHIKCADDEPTRACVDAAGILIDKLAAQPAR